MFSNGSRPATFEILNWGAEVLIITDSPILYNR